MPTSNFAQKQARRIGRNNIIAAALVAVAVVAIMVFAAPNLVSLYFDYPTFAYPYVSSTEISECYDANKVYISVTTDDLFDTGYVVKNDGVIKYRYFAFDADETYVVVRMGAKYAEDDYFDYTVSGKLREPTGIENRILGELAQEIAESWDVTVSEARNALSPFILDATEPRIVGMILPTIGILIILIMLFHIVRGILLIGDYTRSKWFKKLDPTGIENAERVNQLVSRELEGEIAFERPRVRVTKTYFVFMNGSRYSVERRDDLVWAYETITRHYTNGIPSGKSYSMTLRFATGNRQDLPAKNKNAAEELAERIYELAPTAVRGHSKDLEKLYSQAPQNFATAVRFAPNEPVE
ncbi:MAG: hypothetical protein LBN02_06310 [Oscillospiraceae bacterium]|jgi:hypothetical protein|nr:hypothetical protein [Oscillospiraceae bacterium]